MILLTGGTGQLGTAFRQLLDDVAAPGRDELDLADPAAAVEVAERLAPDAIINCAAYTAVDAAEDDVETALTVNGTAVGRLAGYAADADIPFVTFSTDYVFDGNADEPYLESSPTDPINAYGRSKAAGEIAALMAHPGALIVRTSWVISATHRNFVTAILERARAGGVDVVTDQQGCPTFAPDLAVASLGAMEEGVTGILHLTNTGATTWFDLARAACDEAGLDPELVSPTTSEAFPRPAPRPAYSVLGSERLPHLDVDPLPPWRDAVGRLVASLGD